MVQYTGTIVRDGGREDMYRTKRVALVLTLAEKAIVVQIAEIEALHLLSRALAPVLPPYGVARRITGR